MDELLAEVEDVMKAFIEDNQKRGLSGADVNWALIHYASGILRQVQGEISNRALQDGEEEEQND
jgi:hypothetical protein